MIISDRGLYSFLTYQLLKIKSQYKPSIKLKLERWIENIFKPISKIHFVILLTSPIKQIKQRIIERDGSINTQDFRFIKKRRKSYRKFLKNNHQLSIILGNRNDQFENVKQKVIQQIKEILIKEKIPWHFIEYRG